MTDDFKRLAAISALDEVSDGMAVGLGTGSTAAHFIRELGARVRVGLRVIGIPTSKESDRLAREMQIPVGTLADHPRIAVTVDGADEVSPQLDLIKGLGGALVREKIVAHSSDKVVIVVDGAKLVDRLGTRTVIPVEVVPFGADPVLRRLGEWGGQGSLRKVNGSIFVSDNGNYIVDWKHGEIAQPALMEKKLKALTGVVDSGLFCGVANIVIVADSGGIRRLIRS